MSDVELLRARGCLDRRMPSGDPAWLRLAARRSAGFADELRRVSVGLSGCAGSSGWRGVARQEFVRSVAETVPELGRVAGRYEEYAAALVGYAGVLDRVGPELVRLRAKLVDAVADRPATARLTGSADPVDDGRLRYLASQFDDLWNAWDQALGRCRRELGRAGSVDADRHGWSALGHEVVSVGGGVGHLVGSVVAPVVGLVEHPGLASLSGALGGLATDLSVLGGVLLVVCPPAAGVCFTAVAVISAAKLGADAVRAGRGDVGVGVLGADAIAALPGGRMMKAGEDGARAVTALEDLAEHERGTTLVPGGGLAAHEAINGNPEIGHVLRKHVGLSRDEIEARFKAEPSLRFSSTFYDRVAAEKSISSVIAASQTDIRTWLASPEKTLVLKGDFASPVGLTMKRGAEPLHVSGVTVVLRRNYPVWGGYRIHTAFPRP